MFVVIIFLFILISTVISASLLTSRLSASISEQTLAACILGFFYLTLSSTFLLFLGQLQTKSLCILLAGTVLISAGIRHKLTSPRSTANLKERKIHDEKGPIVTTAFIVSAAIVLHTFLGALTPEVRSDPLRYHLRLAQQYALRGAMEPLKENPWWAIPQYAEAVYATGILLWNDTLAKLFHWYAGVLTFGTVFFFTRWRFGCSAAAWALILWATTPKVSYEMTTTYVEMILTLWVFLSFLSGYASLVISDFKTAGRCLLLSGFFMGMAFGTKYTALAVQGVPWLIFPAFFLLTKQGRMKTRIFYFVFSGAALLLADSPWLIRNLYYTGNPLYPLYNHLWGLTEGVDRGIELFFLTVWPGSNLLHPNFYFERIMGLFYSGYVFPGLVVLLPLFHFLLARQEQKRKNLPAADCVAIVFCFLSFLFYLVFTGNMDGRFYLPTLAVMICYLGGITQSIINLLGLNTLKKNSVIFAVLALLTYNYVGQRLAFFSYFRESPLPILSETERWSYYQKHDVGEPEGELWEKIIPNDAFVYNIGFPYRMKAIHPLKEGITDPSIDPSTLIPTSIDPVEDPFQASDRSPEALRKIVHHAGVDYLLLPTHPGHQEGPLWRVAREVFQTVPGSSGRLLKVD